MAMIETTVVVNYEIGIQLSNLVVLIARFCFFPHIVHGRNTCRITVHGRLSTENAIIITN